MSGLLPASGLLHPFYKGAVSLCTYDNEKNLGAPRKDVANMLHTIGTVINAAAIYFGATKLLALGYTKAAYAVLGAGFYTNVGVAMILGAAYAGSLAYARLAPVVSQVFAKNFANVATKNTGFGAVLAYISWTLVSSKAFETVGEHLDTLKFLPFFNVASDMIGAGSQALARMLVTAKKDASEEL